MNSGGGGDRNHFKELKVRPGGEAGGGRKKVVADQNGFFLKWAADTLLKELPKNLGDYNYNCLIIGI